MSQLSLEDFKNTFKYYKQGIAHQERAIEELYYSLDADLKDSDADWIKIYRNEKKKALVNPLVVPYQTQLDNKTGTGYRECFSSCCAMVGMYYGVVSNDDEYNEIRSEFGDTTLASSHVKALASLGLKSEFITNATTDDLKRQIDEGRPTPCGWLHLGPAWKPHGNGHYCTVIGYTDKGWRLHDPFGEADLVNGGYCNHDNGEFQHYSYKNWNPRWIVEGEGSGWMMDIRAA